MMKIKNACYLDANFLISYFLPNHDDHEASKKRLFKLSAQNKNLLISFLALYESFYKICRIYNDQRPPLSREKRPKDFYYDYRAIVSFILKNPLMTFVQFKNDLIQGIKNAVENINKYDLDPGDAFHYAIMQDLASNCIVTKDKDFKRITNINRVTY